MKSDGDLLREFTRTHDQASFAELVERHIGFVYAISLRRMYDVHGAKDATQAVFIALARKARSVAEAPSVAGWLHRSACYQTSYMMRSAKNRAARELEAARLGTTLPDVRPGLAEMGAVLDEVLCELPDRDREAIIERYFLEQNYATIGSKLRLTENAARMRVERALQRLRELLLKRGINSSAVALVAALPTYASTPVPAGLVAAVAKGSVFASAGGLSVAVIFNYMSTTKVIAGLVIATSIAGFVWEANRRSNFEYQLSSTRAELTATSQRLQAIEAKVRVVEAAELKKTSTVTSLPVRTSIPRPTAVPVPGVTPAAPKGWKKNGSANDLFEVGVDANNSWGGMPSAYAKSVGDSTGQFGGMMQTISAESLHGQRVQLSGWMKTQDVTDGGNLWMRVDGAGSGYVLQFDNMNNRAPKGTTDWQDYSIVLDVPAEATTVNYGFFVAGKGQVWVNGLTVTKVGTDVPPTNTAVGSKLPTTPVNLGFTPTAGSK